MTFIAVTDTGGLRHEWVLPTRRPLDVLPWLSRRSSGPVIILLPNGKGRSPTFVVKRPEVNRLPRDKMSSQLICCLSTHISTYEFFTLFQSPFCTRFRFKVTPLTSTCTPVKFWYRLRVVSYKAVPSRTDEIHLYFYGSGPFCLKRVLSDKRVVLFSFPYHLRPLNSGTSVLQVLTEGNFQIMSFRKPPSSSQISSGPRGRRCHYGNGTSSFYRNR